MRHLLILLISILLLSFFLPSCEKKEQVNIIFPDGSKYEGEWKNGKQNGQGTFTDHKLGKYVGEHKDGLPHGQGVFISADGRQYNGEWKEGKLDGQGTWIYPNGDKYAGQFKT